MTLPVLLLLAAFLPAAQESPTTASSPATDTASEAAQDPQDMPAAEAAPAMRPADAGEAIADGLKAFRRRRFKAAETHFRRAVAADPQSAAAHFYLGYTIYKIAEPRRANSPGKQEAAQHFARAYEIDPGFQPAWGPRT